MVFLGKTLRHQSAKLALWRALDKTASSRLVVVVRIVGIVGEKHLGRLCGRLVLLQHWWWWRRQENGCHIVDGVRVFLVGHVGHHDDRVQRHLGAVRRWRIGAGGRGAANAADGPVGERYDTALPRLLLGGAAVDDAAGNGQGQKDGEEHKHLDGRKPGLGVALVGAALAKVVAGAAPDGTEEDGADDDGEDEGEVIVVGGVCGVVAFGVFGIVVLEEDTGDAVEGNGRREWCVRWCRRNWDC